MQCSQGGEHPPHQWGDGNGQVHMCPGIGWCR